MRTRTCVPILWSFLDVVRKDSDLLHVVGEAADHTHGEHAAARLSQNLVRHPGASTRAVRAAAAATAGRRRALDLRLKTGKLGVKSVENALEILRDREKQQTENTVEKNPLLSFPSQLIVKPLALNEVFFPAIIS